MEGAMHRVTRELVEHYESCLAAHGPTCKGMDWGDDASRLAARFAAICRAIGLADHDRTVSVLDAGCGCGLLLDHLDQYWPHRVRYTGVDASASMTEAARRRRPGMTWIVGDVLDAENVPTADWVVANGLLTERRGIPETEMRDFAQAAIRAMFDLCGHGIVFNVMSTHVNYREDHLFYWDPGEVLRFVSANLSRHVSIHHDLPTYDYFCCVRREPRAGAADA
jgi:SAM-dependent methyltransferase